MMTDDVKVKVLRHLNGDEFAPGDTRTLPRADADRLAATGAVEIVGKAVKAAPANKAVQAAPANKASRRRRK